MPWLSIARRDGEPGPEWRKSDWPVTDNLNGGRACPECHVTVHKGARWRAHAAKEERDAERLEKMHDQLVALGQAVRFLAVEAGHGDWYGLDDEDEAPGEEPALRGWVIGNGPLPEEMRGGEE